MELTKLKHYMRRVSQLGLQQSVKIIHNRCKEKFFDSYWRTKAAQKKAHHSWKSAAQKLGIKQDWSAWLLQTKNTIHLSLNDLYLTKNLPELLQAADDFTRNCFDLLGSGKQCFVTIPWHDDFRLKKTDPKAETFFDNTLYYKDFVIKPGKTESLVKDIKIPWEISRLQHFFVLGYAYQQTQDVRYVNTFEHQFLAWCQQNPFLLGSHWACPMDVGIRAVNLVWAFALFKNALSSTFWQHFAAVLYDHFFYLEHNWEVYDFRTSNHYLSDLIGYFYLCYFFYDSPDVQEKATWCFEELLQECEKQIFTEGTDYEGSTAYHKLITEILYHFSVLAKKMGFFLPEHFEEKLKKMITFVDWCTPHNGELIHVGDDDSGKILYYGLTQELVSTLKNKEQKKSVHYEEFGLSVIKTDAWHSTLRHHTYNERQPSGHFHSDVGSITVALDGISIFTDPGSYIYTPSALWRNYFRTTESHSTFFLQNQEPVPIDDRLFTLALPEQEGIQQERQDEHILFMQHALYRTLGITAYRSITLSEDERIITITDWFEAKEHSESHEWCWYFVLNPDVMITSTHEKIILLHQKKPFVEITSTLSFELVNCFVAPQYGVKKPSKKLKALQKLEAHQRIVTTIKKIC